MYGRRAGEPDEEYRTGLATLYCEQTCHSSCQSLLFILLSFHMLRRYRAIVSLVVWRQEYILLGLVAYLGGGGGGFAGPQRL